MLASRSTAGSLRYTMLGAVFTTLVSLVCSIFFGFNDPTDVPAELITPMLRKYIHKPNLNNHDKPVVLTVKDTEI
jgi:hypothetical protein